mmetsp:Transcript_8240/g.13333  ORF Transcript_8240/g.13333 Transcript_8240/m.13333 type:complete len:1154 (+) Transcript_8240:593-4054(+)
MREQEENNIDSELVGARMCGVEGSEMLALQEKATREQVEAFVGTKLCEDISDDTVLSRREVNLVLRRLALPRLGETSSGDTLATPVGKDLADDKAYLLKDIVKSLCADTGVYNSHVENVPNKNAIPPVAMLPVGSVECLVPDQEGCAAVSNDVSSQRKLIKRFQEHLLKLKTNIFKSWTKRWLVVDGTGIGYGKQPRKEDFTTFITFDKIVDVRPATLDDHGPKVKLKQESFLVKTREDRVHIFASEAGGAPAAKWCMVIASHALIHAIQKNAGLDRVAALCGMGADVNVSHTDGRQYPPLALALVAGSWDVARYLLRRGADPSCLLRWSFLMIDKVIKPVDLLQLLIETQKDLNVCGDDPHEWSLLHYLAYVGDLDSVKQLISRVDIPTLRAVNTLGDCSLMLALKRHPCPPTEMVEALCVALSKKCNVKRRDKWNDSLLHLAIKKQHVRLAQVLIRQGASVEEQDSHGDTALHLAVKVGELELAKWMVDCTSEKSRLLDILDKANGDTALVLAIKLGLEELALFFLERGADCTIQSRSWGLGADNCSDDSPLHIAIKMDMQRLAEAIVSKESALEELCKLDTNGVPALIIALRQELLHLGLVMIRTHPNCDDFLNIATSKEGETALHVAVKRGWLVMASTMIDAGADVNMQNNHGFSIMHQCVLQLSDSYGHYHSALLLTFMESILYHSGQSIDASAQAGPMDYTPLHFCILNSNIDGASLLLGFSHHLADDCDKDGNCALHLAIMEESASLVELLIQYRANVNIINKNNLSALHLAVQLRRQDVIKQLLQQNAYPGVWDGKGRCPVHLAALMNDADLVEALVSNCSDPGHIDLRTEDGYTAVMLSAINGDADTVKVLVSHGADLNAKLPRTRAGIFHIAADLCAKKRKPFWGSEVGMFLLDVEHQTGIWDQDCEGTSVVAAKNILRKRMMGDRYHDDGTRIKSSEMAIQQKEEEQEEFAPAPSLSLDVDLCPSGEEKEEAVPLPPPALLAALVVASPRPAPVAVEDERVVDGEHECSDDDEHDASSHASSPRSQVCPSPKSLDSSSSSSSDSLGGKDTKSVNTPEETYRAAVSSLTDAQRLEILEEIKEETRNVAEEWLKTSSGKTLLEKRALHTLNHSPLDLTLAEARSLAKHAFIEEHLSSHLPTYLL